jgi:hypothetical protein
MMVRYRDGGNALVFPTGYITGFEKVMYSHLEKEV